MNALVLRLKPGQDLREEIESFVDRERIQAGAIVTCVGSLTRVALRPIPSSLMKNSKSFRSSEHFRWRDVTCTSVFPILTE